MSAIPLCRFASGGAILSCHSITTPELPAEGDAHLPLEAFESLVRVARCLGQVVPLSDLVRRHLQGLSTSGLIAVTLDDAYAALGTEFRDVISRRNIPITVFVVSQAAATGATFWWDRIDDLFPRVAPDRWRTFETTCGLPEAYRRGQPRDYGPLRPLRQWVLAAYAGRWPDHLEPALCDLEQEVGWRTLHRSMTFDELEDLMATGLVEVGVHTMSHPVLPLLPDPDLRHEIVASHDALRERFGTILPVLAVPFGLYDGRTLHAARSAGMIASLTLAGETLAGGGPRDALPRLCLTRSDTRVRLALRLLGLPALKRSWAGGRLALYPDLPSPTT
jgi:peptidoglycan/xylan/chitin deacetylase (PgdA/CDA1 family)